MIGPRHTYGPEYWKALQPTIDAFIAGKVIQCVAGNGDDWTDIYQDGGAIFSAGHRYRIKPDPTWRPFAPTDEAPDIIPVVTKLVTGDTRNYYGVAFLQAREHDAFPMTYLVMMGRSVELYKSSDMLAKFLQILPNNTRHPFGVLTS